MRIVETIWNAPFVKGLLKNTWNGHYRKVFVVHGNIPFSDKEFAGNIGHDEISNPESMFSQEVQRADVWIIHRYVPSFRTLIKERRQFCLILIQTWGPDYLNFFSRDFELYQPKTFQILKSLKPAKSKSGKQIFLEQFKRIRRVILGFKFNVENRRAFELVDGVMFCLPNESAHISGTKIRNLSPVRVNQYDNKVYCRSAQRSINYKWVQLGNSADPSNNHIEALFFLREKNLEVEKILIPLSYGGTPEYVKVVKTFANQLFPDKCVFLESMMDQNDFFDLTDQYGIFVSNVTRQQSLGNLYAAINRGAFIMLNSRSIVFDFLQEINLNVEPLNSDLPRAFDNLSFDSLRVKEESKILQHFLSSMTIEMAQDKIINLYNLKFSQKATS